MMSILPLGINNWPLANLDYAIAWHKTSIESRTYEIDMSPVITMVMNVISQFTEKNSLGSQNPVGLPYERRKRVRERVVILLGGSQHQTKTRIEVLRLVLALVRNMRRVIHNYVK